MTELKRRKKLERAKLAGAREAERESKRRYKEKRRLERACFWTWPWGHVRPPYSDPRKIPCRVCGKKSEYHAY